MEASVVSKFSKWSDTEIIGKVIAGDTALYEIIIRRYNPYLYKIARSYGYRHDEAQDIMQDTFVNAFINLSGFRHRATFKTWIIRIMLNNCYQKAQKFSYKNEIPEGEFINDNMKPMFTSHDQSDMGRSIINRELGHIIEEAITALPMDYRMVFSLREINGMSTAETAESLGLSEANVKVRLNRAKKMLRQGIEKMYSPDEIFEFNLVHCDPMVERVLSKIEKMQITHP